jgi:hypothetical protein
MPMPPHIHPCLRAKPAGALDPPRIVVALDSTRRRPHDVRQEERALSTRRLLPLIAVVALATNTLADTLVLRSGRRIEGDLVGVRGSSVEFDESGGGARRYDRSEVARIELGSGSSSSGYRDDRAFGRPSGLREKTTSIDAASGWSDTGIEVRSGMTVYFDASGKVQWGPDRKHGPAGEGGNHKNPNRPMPNRAGGSLIGRVGGNAAFFIGDDRGPIRMRESGRLSLGVNDDFLQDNRGSFRVTIYY